MPDRRGPRDPVSLAGRPEGLVWLHFHTNMATINIEFKDTKTGVDVRIKEVAALKRAVKADKYTPAQEHALRIFHAIKTANEILAAYDGPCCGGKCDCK